MGLFSKKEETVVKTETKSGVNYAQKLASIKNSFKIAHENASNLHSLMERDIQEKQDKIKELQDSIDTINVAKKDAETFMENISKLI